MSGLAASERSERAASDERGIDLGLGRGGGPTLTGTDNVGPRSWLQWRQERQEKKKEEDKKKDSKIFSKNFHFWKASHTNKVQKLYLL